MNKNGKSALIRYAMNRVGWTGADGWPQIRFAVAAPLAIFRLRSEATARQVGATRRSKIRVVHTLEEDVPARLVELLRPGTAAVRGSETPRSLTKYGQV